MVQLAGPRGLAGADESDAPAVGSVVASPDGVSVTVVVEPALPVPDGVPPPQPARARAAPARATAGRTRRIVCMRPVFDTSHQECRVDAAVLGTTRTHPRPRRSHMTVVPTLTLNNGVEIPQLGFGVFQIEPEKTKDATLAALEVGYRHIDTAEMYGNEKEVGEAVRASGIDRGDLFVTSKLNNGFHAYDDALGAFDQTLADLDIEYLDLFLVHWPLPGVGDFVETWKAMETIYASGRVRAIGVSNFQPDPPAPDPRRDQRDAGRQPDRGAPLPRQRRGARLRRRARHRHRGLVADRAGQGARRPDHRADRRERRQDARPRSPCAGTCSAATSCSPSR